jgi:hypothetical protein
MFAGAAARSASGAWLPVQRGRGRAVLLLDATGPLWQHALRHDQRNP